MGWYGDRKTEIEIALKSIRSYPKHSLGYFLSLDNLESALQRVTEDSYGGYKIEEFLDPEDLEEFNISEDGEVILNVEYDMNQILRYTERNNETDS